MWSLRSASKCWRLGARPATVSALLGCDLQQLPKRHNSAAASTNVKLAPPSSRATDPYLPLLTRMVEEHEAKALPRYRDLATRTARMAHNTVNESYRYMLVSVRDAYTLVEDPQKVTAETLHHADVMECILRLRKASFMLWDDVVDDTNIRHGEASWQAEIPERLLAFHDGNIANAVNYKMIEEHLSHLDYYTRFVGLIQEITMDYAYAQHMDLVACTSKGPLSERYTMPFMQLMHTLNLGALISAPLAAAIIMTGKEATDEAYAKHIADKLGYLWHVQNDVVDVYMTPEDYGHDACDIRGGKCSWLIIEAMRRCSKEQMSTLQRCYGSQDPTDVAEVKAVYDDLRLKQIYDEHEKELVAEVRADIGRLPTGGVRTFYEIVLQKMFVYSYH